MATSITVDDLDIYYGDFLAVEGVSMTVKARSVTAWVLTFPLAGLVAAGCYWVLHLLLGQ